MGSLAGDRSGDEKRSLYKVIGFQLEVRMKQLARTVDSMFVGLGNYDAKSDGITVRGFDVHDALKIATINHFQIMHIDKCHSYLDGGVDVALDLFFGDWWKQDKRFNAREEVDNDINDISWFSPFSEGLLLAMLTNRWKDVDRLCNWVHAELSPGFDTFQDVEPEIAAFYLIVAADLRREPFEGVDKFRATIEESRRKQGKLLLQAWDAVMSQDQAGFERSIKDLLQRFDKTVEKTGIGMAFTRLLAQPESIICLVAMHRGMRFPDLPEKLAAYVITRTTLGLEN